MMGQQQASWEKIGEALRTNCDGPLQLGRPGQGAWFDVGRRGSPLPGAKYRARTSYKGDNLGGGMVVEGLDETGTGAG